MVGLHHLPHYDGCCASLSKRSKSTCTGDTPFDKGLWVLCELPKDAEVIKIIQVFFVLQESCLNLVL